MPNFRIANASQVTAQLWVGGDLEVFDRPLAEAQLDELDSVGLTHIVDLREEWDDSGWVTEAKPHIRYLWLGEDDAGQQMPDEWFEAGTAHVLGVLADPGSRVLVHCHMGVNRGPSMAYAVMLALGWDPIEALESIRAARPIAFVGYAEDALDWWLRRRGATDTERRAAQRRVAQWRRANHLDVADVIRKIRLEEDRKQYRPGA